MLKSLQISCCRYLLPAVMLLGIGTAPGLAQTLPGLKTFQPPVNPDEDLNSTGGATRGDGCHNLDSESSTSLIPFSPRDAQLARTQAARPKFRTFIAPTEAQYGVFTLQDAEGYVYYHGEMIALPEKGGIVTITLPDDVELAPSQTYRWFLELLCAGQIDPSNPIAEGQIQRVLETPSHSMTPAIATLTTEPAEDDRVTIILSRVESYQQSQLWYEAIDILAAARRANPDNVRLNAAWAELLELAGITATDVQTLQSF